MRFSDEHQIELVLMQRYCHRAELRTEVSGEPTNLLARLDGDSAGCVVADLRMKSSRCIDNAVGLYKRLLAAEVDLDAASAPKE